MSEFYSRAVVLSRDSRGEADGEVRLFTENYGKVIVRAKSINKITSKSSAHLQPLRFVQARWTESRKTDGRLILLDVLWDERMAPYITHQRHDLIPLLQSLDKICMEFQPEPRVWQLLQTVFCGRYNIKQTGRAALSLLGLHPEHEKCARCGAHEIGGFLASDACFVCEVCASQVSADEIVLEV